MKRKVITILFCFVSLMSEAQMRQSRHFGSEHLTCNFITDICQDKEGFIWIGTLNGLNRYDGWSFSHYYSEEGNDNTLSNNYVYCLFSDSQDRLWIGMNNGLQVYDKATLTFTTIYFPDNKFLPVENIIEINEHELWVIEGAIYSINTETNKAELNEVLNILTGNTASKGYKDADGYVWLTISSRRILRVNPADTDDYLIIEAGFKASSMAEIDGTIYATNGANVFYWSNLRGEFVMLENECRPYSNVSLLSSSDKTIYLSNKGTGYRKIDTDRKVVLECDDFHCEHFDITASNVDCWIEDNQGNIWIGFFRDGLLLSQKNASSFESFSINSSTDGHRDGILSVYVNENNSIWIGTESYALYHLTDREVQHVCTLNSAITSISDYSDKSLLVGTRYGGFHFVDKLSGESSWIDGTSGYYGKRIEKTDDGTLILALFDRGFATLNPDDNTYTEYNNVGTVNTLLCDNDNLVWIGTYNGIDCFSLDRNEKVLFPSDSSLQTSVVYSLEEDKNGQIWIGTTEGLYSYNRFTRTYQRYSEHDELPNDVICGLACDSKGNIWGSTFHGIFKLNPTTGSFDRYAAGDGLIDSEFTRSCYWNNSDGIIAFGGYNGLTYFYPNEITNIRLSQKPILTHLSNNNQIIPNGKNRFKHNENNLNMRFSLMSFRSPTEMHFDYSINSRHDDWHSTSDGSNEIHLVNLRPGKYRLKIRACKNAMYSPETLLDFQIMRPWFTSVPALMVYILLTLVTVWHLQQTRKKNVRKRELEKISEERLRMFTNLSHELRTPMTLIVSPLNKMIKTDYDSATNKMIRSMKQNADRIISLLNQIMDVRKLDNGKINLTYSEVDIIEFMEKLLVGFEYQLDQYDIALNFSHSLAKLNVWIDQNNFDKVLINVLGNALKYTPAGGLIDVSVEKEGNEVEIKVSDTGTGVDSQKIGHIFERFYQADPKNASGSGIGLHLSESLVEMHKGSISAENRTDCSGAIFTIRLPLGNEHIPADRIVQSGDIIRNATEQAIYWGEKPALGENPDRPIIGHRHNILIIDDNADICNYLKDELSQKYNVTICTNAIDGYQTALEITPDLIISDIMMPDIDGFTLLKKVKGNQNTAHVPVILLTAIAEEDIRMQGWLTGADAVLSKPFNIKELELICSNLIEGRSRLISRINNIHIEKELVKQVEMKSNDEILMEKIISLININIDDPGLNVEFLCREIGISRAHLHRKMKEMADIPPGEYIRNIRLNQAAELLKGDKQSISQVAYAVGFSNPSIFSTAFKLFFGISPKEYQEKNHQQELSQK